MPPWWIDVKSHDRFFPNCDIFFQNRSRKRQKVLEESFTSERHGLGSIIELNMFGFRRSEIQIITDDCSVKVIAESTRGGTNDRLVRTIALPCYVIRNSLKASLRKDGILTLLFQKKECCCKCRSGVRKRGSPYHVKHETNITKRCRKDVSGEIPIDGVETKIEEAGDQTVEIKNLKSEARENDVPHSRNMMEAQKDEKSQQTNLSKTDTDQSHRQESFTEPPTLAVPESCSDTESGTVSDTGDGEDIEDNLTQTQKIILSHANVDVI